MKLNIVEDVDMHTGNLIDVSGWLVWIAMVELVFTTQVQYTRKGQERCLPSLGREQRASMDQPPRMQHQSQWKVGVLLQVLEA